MKEFQVLKNDLSLTRIDDLVEPEIGPDEILVELNQFGFSANNITYGTIADQFGYWDFFPTQNEWGALPVWGFATVIESKVKDVPVGDRLFGYFPMRAKFKLKPVRVSERTLFDGAPHRAHLPAVYNNYVRVLNEPGYDGKLDNERMLFFPLYGTSFCIYDFLIANEWFGAEQIVILSASSNTAIGVAYGVAEDPNGPPQIGVTSSRNLNFVKSLGIYNDAVTYDALEDVPSDKPTVIIDMSANGVVLDRLHSHLGEHMKHCANVGFTHWDESTLGDGFIKERSAMFFAPDHIDKRIKEWEPGALPMKTFQYWHMASVKSQDWLELQFLDGLDALTDKYQDVLKGELAPERGLIINLSPS